MHFVKHLVQIYTFPYLFLRFRTILSGNTQTKVATRISSHSYRFFVKYNRISWYKCKLLAIQKHLSSLNSISSKALHRAVSRRAWYIIHGGKMDFQKFAVLFQQTVFENQRTDEFVTIEGKRSRKERSQSFNVDSMFDSPNTTLRRLKCPPHDGWCLLRPGMLEHRPERASSVSAGCRPANEDAGTQEP